jgi:hypothetical protein
VPIDQLVTVSVSGAHFSREEFRPRDVVKFFGSKKVADESMTSPLLTIDDNPSDQLTWLKNDTMQSSSSLMATNNFSVTASSRRTITSSSTSGSATISSLHQSKSSQKSNKTELSQEEQDEKDVELGCRYIIIGGVLIKSIHVIDALLGILLLNL